MPGYAPRARPSVKARLHILWRLELLRLQLVVERDSNVCGMIGQGQRQVMITREMSRQKDGGSMAPSKRRC